MHVIAFILFGLIVGLIARFLMPGRQPMGFILTALLGIGGSYLGAFLSKLMRGDQGDMVASDPYNWLGAIVGSLLLLFVYSMVAGRRTSV